MRSTPGDAMADMRSQAMKPTHARRAAALAAATASAAVEMSVAMAEAPVSNWRVTASAPYPVPTSSTRAPGRSSLRAVSTTCSVSGRGIRTSGVTRNSRPQNSWRRVMYCVGLPCIRSCRYRPKCSHSRPVNSCSGQAKRYSRVRPRAWASRTSAVRRGAMTPLSSSREVPCRSAVLTVTGSDGRAVLGLLLQLFGLVVGGERFHDHVQFSVHDEVELMQGEADAVVGHAILRKVVGADLLAAVARADHAAPLRAQRR